MQNSLQLKTPGAYPTYLSLGYNWAEENLLNLDGGKHPSQISNAIKQSIFDFIVGRKTNIHLENADEDDKKLYCQLLIDDNAKLYTDLKTILSKYRNYHSHICHSRDKLPITSTVIVNLLQNLFSKAKDLAYKKTEECRLAHYKKLNAVGKEIEGSNDELNTIVNNTIKKIEQITLFEHENKVLTDDYGAVFFMNLFLYKWQANYILGKLKGFKSTNVNEEDGAHKFYGKPRREFFTRHSLREGFDLFSDTDDNITFRQLVNFLYAKPMEFEKIINPEFYEKTILSRGKLAKEIIDKLHKEKQQKEKINTRRNSERIFIIWALCFIEDFYNDKEKEYGLKFLVYEREYADNKKTDRSRTYDKERKHDGITGKPTIEKRIYRGFAPGAMHDYKYVITYKNVFAQITKDNKHHYISIGIHELKYWVFALLAGKGTNEILQKFIRDVQFANKTTAPDNKTAKEKLQNRLLFIQSVTNKLIEENKDYPEVKRWRYASKRKIKLIMLYLNRFVLQGNYLNRLDYKEIEEKIRWNFKFNKELIMDILRSYKNENAINFIMKADSIEDLFITGSNSLLAVIEKELTALQSTTLSGEAYREMESLMPFNGKEFGEKPLNEGKDNKRYYHIIAPGFIKKRSLAKETKIIIFLQTSGI